MKVVNLDPERTRQFRYNLYSMEGRLIYSSPLSLPPLAEIDLQAGHAIRNAVGVLAPSVYLVEIVPTDPSTPYLMWVSRYSSIRVAIILRLPLGPVEK